MHLCICTYIMHHINIKFELATDLLADRFFAQQFKLCDAIVPYGPNWQPTSPAGKSFAHQFQPCDETYRTARTSKRLPDREVPCT